MNGIHPNGKNCNLEKAFPGCLGRMVNLFDLNVGLAGNRLLTDKPHRDGSPLSSRSSDVARTSPSGDQIQGKVIVSESSRTGSNRKSNGTPMKMLIAQEMSKEVDTRQSPPNVVAKLMGLDALPQQQHNSATQRSHFRGSCRSHSDVPSSYWERQNGFFEYNERDDYRDVYEIWQHTRKSECARDKSPHGGRYAETTNDKMMALVRQKFMEAKRLSVDEKLRQSKQFQDALEVLNANKDLFLKCMQEPNSIFAQHPYDLQSIPPPPESKRITVLRPSKMVDSSKSAGAGSKSEKQTKKGVCEKSQLEYSPISSWKINENPSQPTRIVVLKPSTGKLHDVKAVGSPTPASPRISGEELEFVRDTEDDETQESREVARAITHQMCEKLGRHRRDETLLSSVFSNGYVGDESSFNKSEIEYAAGNLSDSEVMSPVSRHSWDYVNRFGSPYSLSSFSRASYSPESSVCREAKKRLSERWAMMASNGTYQEQRHLRRSSSTLGEMLALSETKKTGRSEEDGIVSEEPRDSTSQAIGYQKRDEEVNNSPRNLLRSKSVPVSSTEFSNRLNVQNPDSDKGGIEVPKEAPKSRSGKSSLRGKVSSLFFSRNKKASKEKSPAPKSKDEPYSSRVVPGQLDNDKTQCLSGKGLERLSPTLQDSSSKASSPNLFGKQGITSSEGGFGLGKSGALGNPSENQDQPSPISVLDPPFEEYEHMAPEFSGCIKPARHDPQLPVLPITSNLIDKSPPIGSIARTLSLDDSCVGTATSYPLTQPLPPQGAEEEEREWFFFIETLLSVAGLEGEVQSNSFLARWHSPDSPLDPSLRDKYIDLKDKETLHEAKRRQKRSTRKLVFDCVNAALVDIAGYGSDFCQRAIPTTGAGNSSLENVSLNMVDQIWCRVKILLSGEVKCVSGGDYGDDNNLVGEGMVRKEVVGKGWSEHLRLEMDNLGKEIEAELLEELVQEAVVEWTASV